MGLFSWKGPPAVRQVNEQAATAFGAALARTGAVTHADDPQRSVAFASGGSPVWSIAFVGVPGPRPYTLVVTFGLSYAISPESDRAGIGYELSLAIPHGEPVTWADAFLRGYARYLLTQKAQLAVGECVPFRGVPITQVGIAPEQVAMAPATHLVGMLVARDPLLSNVSTPAGDVEIRRVVGVDQYEIDRAVTWDPAAFLELVRGVDPLLLTPLQRPSHMPALAAAIEPRAQRDGSTVEGVMLDLAWQQGPYAVRILLPQGPAAQRALGALRGRIGFGRKLVAFSTQAPPITFTPGPAGIDVTPQGLELVGDLASPPISMIVEALAAGAPAVDVPVQAPPPARVRARFFERVAAVVRTNELDQQRMTRELGKLVDEARTIAAMEAQVPATERDADRAAATAVVRTLRFARTTDQSVIEPLVQLLSPK